MHWIHRRPAAIILLACLTTLVGCDNADKAKLTNLEAENASLKARLEALDNPRLEAENAALKARVEKLTQSYRELEKKLLLTDSSQGEKSEQTGNSQGAAGELQVKLLRICRSSAPSNTRLEFHVTNNSDQFLSSWQIGADVYNRGGEYLAHGYEIGHNLRPRQTATASILLQDVQAQDVAKWKPQIESASGKNNEDIMPTLRLATAR
jgi:hypothetical protein